MVNFWTPLFQTSKQFKTKKIKIWNLINPVRYLKKQLPDKCYRTFLEILLTCIVNRIYHPYVYIAALQYAIDTAIPSMTIDSGGKY